MILTLDIGNSGVSAAVFPAKATGVLAGPLAHWRVRRPVRAGSAWWKELASLVCLEAGLAPGSLDGCAVSSVVPSFNRPVSSVMKSLTGRAPLQISGSLGTGIRFAYTRPETLGPDRVCAMIAGVRRFGVPVIVVDCGTAITIDGVGRGKRHAGGMIAPGLGMSARALSRGTAALPDVGWTMPSAPAGADTASCIRAGVWASALGGIRESVRELRAALGGRENRKVIVVGTGGDAPGLALTPGLFDAVEPHLVLEGAALAWLAVRGRHPARRSAT